MLLGAAASGAKVKNKVHDEIVKDDDGIPLFRIRNQRTTIALLLPAERISGQVLQQIREAVANALRECTSKVSVARYGAKPVVERGSDDDARVPL